MAVLLRTTTTSTSAPARRRRCYAANKNLGPDDPTKSPKQYQSVTLPTLAPAHNLLLADRLEDDGESDEGRADLQLHHWRDARRRRTCRAPWADRDIGSVPVGGSAQYPQRNVHRDGVRAPTCGGRPTPSTSCITRSPGTGPFRRARRQRAAGKQLVEGSA